MLLTSNHQVNMKDIRLESNNCWMIISINTVSSINIIEFYLLDMSCSRENSFQERTARNIIIATCTITTAKSMRRIIRDLFFFKRDTVEQFLIVQHPYH